MIKNILLMPFLLVFAAITMAGAQTPQYVIVDKVVAVVGNSVILYSDLVELKTMFSDERRKEGVTSDRNPDVEALESLMLQKLLYNQAQIDSLTVNKSSILERADEMVYEMSEEMGGVAALEKYYNKAIFEIKSEVAAMIEEREYAQEMRSEITRKVTITPGEVEKFFKSRKQDELPVIPEQYVYAQITKYPLSTQEAKQRTRERLLGMREDIILKGRRFELLARSRSDDLATAVRGGELGFMSPESLAPEYAAAMQKLKPGQVSEVVETEFGFHIIQLVEQRGNTYNTRHILLRPQFTPQELDATNALLNGVVRSVRADSLTFAKAALEFSDDKYSKLNGGLVSNLEVLENRGIFEPSRATTKHIAEDIQPVGDVSVLRSLKPGEISEAFTTTDQKNNTLSKVLKLIEIIPAHKANLQEDYLRISELALAEKKNKDFSAWLAGKINSMYVRIAPEYRIESEFENKVWLK